MFEYIIQDSIKEKSFFLAEYCCCSTKSCAQAHKWHTFPNSKWLRIPASLENIMVKYIILNVWIYKFRFLKIQCITVNCTIWTLTLWMSFLLIWKMWITYLYVINAKESFNISKTYINIWKKWITSEQVEGVILSHFYSLSFLVRGLLHA